MVLKAPFLVPHITFSNQGSLKNNFLEEFFKEPITVPQTKKMVLQQVMVLRRTTKPFKEPFKNHYFSVCRGKQLAWLQSRGQIYPH